MWVKKILVACGVVALLAGCGVNNNVTFTTSQGSCADGTNNAPYCMSVTIQNNSGGQNYINSSNFPIQGLTLAVNGPSNVNYPVSTGSYLDPNGCLNSTVSPGGNCTFYLQLTGESAPVASRKPIQITATYTINNTLFGGSNTSASASTTVYEYPALVVSSTFGSAINYSNSGVSAAFSAESGTAAVVANNNDNYYGFLYLITYNGNITLSGTESYAYNITESTLVGGNANNIVINGTNAYPITSGGNIYTSSIKPIANINWATLSTSSSLNLLSNIRATGLGYVYVANSSQVFACNLNSGSQTGCVQEAATTNGTVKALGYSILGTSDGGSNLTGLVVGTQSGLFAESGIAKLPTNGWIPVKNGTTGNIVNQINVIVSDNNQNLYIADYANNIYEMAVNGGNSATLLTNLAGPSNQIISMVYDNAGSVLYVATNSGNIYGCFNNNGTFDCGNPVASNIFPNNVFGINIITSLWPN